MNKVFIDEECISKEFSVVKQTQSERPPKYELQYSLPFNELKDSEFELLLYLVCQKNQEIDKLLYDQCALQSGPGDKGRDIILLRNSETVGVIQCKRYSKKLTKPECAKEIIKFALHKIQDVCKTKMTYILATSTGFTPEAVELIGTFKNSIVIQPDLDKWIKDVIRENKSIKLKYDDIRDELEKELLDINIQKLLPIDITLFLNPYPDILNVFFKYDKVIDTKAFEDILSGNNLNIDQFRVIYQKNAVNNYSRVNFIGLALSRRPREVKLDLLFVKPSIRLRDSRLNINNSIYFENINFNDLISEKNIKNKYNNSNSPLTIQFQKIFGKIFTSTYKDFIEKNNNTELKQLFDSHRNLVILGRPGAGKSSLVKYAICKILQKDITIFENRKIFDTIPFRVELHKYNKEKIDKHFGIVEYLAKLLENEFQLTFITKKALENLIENYDTIIFFDGLDEIIDIQERINIRNDIENFLNTTSRARIVVTSRYESYEEVYFKDKEFGVYEILDFDDLQVQEYVNKWYLCEEEDGLLREQEVIQCLKAIEKIEDEIKGNPLLLSLILILYRNDLELPTSKLDLYESCTNTLVDMRDQREKKINTNLKIKNKIACFSMLAYWQFDLLEKKKEKSIDHQSVVVQIKNYLIKKGEFEEDSEAQEAAEEFLNFARIRSIFVDNFFTHKTFLEYFTAYYIYSNYQAKGKFKERDEFIEKYIGKTAWIVVLELLICKIDKEQADSEVMDEIIDKAILINIAGSLSLFLYVLKYLRNRPSKIRELIDSSIDYCIQNIRTENQKAARLINNALLGLSKMEPYDSLIKAHVDYIGDNYTKNGNIEINFVIFIMENSIECPQLEGIKKNAKLWDKLLSDAYVFILLNFGNLAKDSEYYDLLQIFKVKFGATKVVASFYSRFGNGIFGGVNRFNWITIKLFESEDYEKFLSVLSAFKKKCKIKQKDILNAIRQDKESIVVSETTLLTFLDKTTNKNDEINEIIVVALRRYYQRYETYKKTINHSFYKDMNFQRKFPVPK